MVRREFERTKMEEEIRDFVTHIVYIFPILRSEVIFINNFLVVAAFLNNTLSFGKFKVDNFCSFER